MQIHNKGLIFFSEHVLTPLLKVELRIGIHLQGHADEIDKGLSAGITFVCRKIKEILNKAIDYVPYLIHSAAKVRKWKGLNDSLMLRKQNIMFIITFVSN